MAIREIPAAMLVEDLSLYPREKIDEHNVAQLAEAHKAGAEVAPPLVAEDGYVVVDGWHRRRAWMRVFGPEEPMPCEVRAFGDRAEMLLEAVRRNTAHGNRLSTVDRKRCLLLAEEYEIDEPRMWSALHVRPETARRWTAARAVVRTKTESGELGSGAPTFKTEGLKPVRKKVLKGSMEHLSGQTITEEQEEAMEHAGGLRQSYYVAQVVNLIEGGLLDRSDEKLMARVRHLRHLLNGLEDL